ncbi:MAG: UDP-N-acetylmuramoylalanine--D-glutamate ligase [Candidatus Parcubacteria bacterium]|nr:MAG: UDP-N-acetylmuramoylalanine--D-glutamate ligase [Candidatus Parcubacteria bacterium]
MLFKNKRVLIFGLGSLGGGLANVEFFIKNKAQLRITDLKTEKELKGQIKKIEEIIQRFNYKFKIKYILGKHRKKDFDWANIIVVNPAISYKNIYVKYAQKKKKIIVNDCYLFFKLIKSETIAITGTRGKTTTSYFTYQLFKKFINKSVILGGNQPEKALLKIINKQANLFILELSSFQLEFYQSNLKAPKIAVITNLYNDHLDRYQTMKEYALTKAKIFLNQTKNDLLILNYDNKWTNIFLRKKPKSNIFYISGKKNKNKLNGVFVFNKKIIIKSNKELIKIKIEKIKHWGIHNIFNLATALLIIYLYASLKKIKLNWSLIEKYLDKLKFPEFRQQIVYKKNNLIIINDSASTAPQATIEAIKRFAQKNLNLILIIGGTDKNLDFKELAKIIKSKIKPKNLIILNGTASQKLFKNLKLIKYNLNSNQICDSLENCLKKALELINKKKNNLILFSPGAASFEKFKNEFDRGKKFNLLIKKLVQK